MASIRWDFGWYHEQPSAKRWIAPARVAVTQGHCAFSDDSKSVLFVVGQEGADGNLVPAGEEIRNVMILSWLVRGLMPYLPSMPPTWPRTR
jgi:hypothetical protein